MAKKTYIVKRGSIMVGTRRRIAGMGVSLDAETASAYLDLDVIVDMTEVTLLSKEGLRILRDGESALTASEASLHNMQLPWIRESLRYMFGLRDADLPNNREYIIGLALQKQKDWEKKRVRPVLYAG